MKYEGIIAILDGQPDISGDVLTDNVELPSDPIYVTNDFQGPPIGSAVVKREGNNIVAEIEIDTSKMPPEVVEQLKGVVGGIITQRNGPLVEEWILKHVGLTDNPCDTRLPNLKRIK